jgi:hypothetical protein
MTDPKPDEKVTRAYRALGGEEPPRALDEAILAASRRRPARWRVPLSIAAVLVLAVGVTLRMLPPQPGAESVALAPQVIETPRPAAGSAEPPARHAQDAQVSALAPRQPVAGLARSDTGAAAPALADARAERSEAPTRPGEARAPAALASAKRAQTPAAIAGAPRADEVSASAVMQSAPATPAAAAAKLSEAALTPEEWLKRIAELRKQGHEREAQESLAAFKKRYPDYKIPEALTR